MRSGTTGILLLALAGLTGAAQPTNALADDAKPGRRGLPIFGASNVGKALADPKGNASSSATESTGPGAAEFNTIMSICGPTTDWSDVELYTGQFGPTKRFVADRQPAVAQIQWNDDLAGTLVPQGLDPGNVEGQRWCTGTLISNKHFITAAHCFEPQSDPQGWKTPRRKVAGAWQSLAAQELAPLMHLNFNYQVNGGDPLKKIRSADAYPIVKLVEYGFGHPSTPLDYAIIEVGPNAGGKLPSNKFGTTAFDATDAGLANAAVLTLIQHPHGEPKKIMAGPKASASGASMSYRNLDTLGGSSGSGIIAESGKIIGVHTNGGCSASGGANVGVPLTAIRTISTIIK